VVERDSLPLATGRDLQQVHCHIWQEYSGNTVQVRNLLFNNYRITVLRLHMLLFTAQKIFTLKVTKVTL
jgi:hypothetical protein